MSTLPQLLAQYTPNDMVVSLIDVSEGRPNTLKYSSPTVTKFLADIGLSISDLTVARILPIPRTDYFVFLGLFNSDINKVPSSVRFTRPIVIS